MDRSEPSRGHDGRLFGWLAVIGSVLPLLPLLWARWATVLGYGVVRDRLGPTLGPTVPLDPFRGGFVVPPVLLALALVAALISGFALARGRLLRPRTVGAAGLVGVGVVLSFVFGDRPGWLVPDGPLHGLPGCRDGGLPCVYWDPGTARQRVPLAILALVVCGLAGALRAWRWTRIEQSAVGDQPGSAGRSDVAVLGLIIASAFLITVVLVVWGLSQWTF